MVDTDRSADADTVGRIGGEAIVVADDVTGDDVMMGLPPGDPTSADVGDGVGGRPDSGLIAENAGAAGAGEAPRRGSRPRRVVVADDADGVRELLCLLLGTEPDFVVVGAAANGAEAIDEVIRTEPDLVLLDLAMPVLDGIGALPRIRSLAPRATVVIFTGFSENTLLDQVLELGADALLEKGLATGLLVEQLRRLCAMPRSA